MFLGRASLRNSTDWLLPKLYGPDYWVHSKVLTNIFFMIKKIFFCRMNIYLRNIDILFVTQTFSVSKYISEMRYIVFTFSFIFFSIKIFFFRIKTFFSVNNVYFVKSTNIFSNKIFFFFNLVLQQMNNQERRLQVW